MNAKALTPFRLHLDHLDPTDRGDILRYLRLLHDVGDDAVEELSPRLLKAMTNRDFRLLVAESAFYYPWPGWIEPLAKLLRHESDLEVFESGTRCLARMGTGPASETLKELYSIRHATAFQEILSQALILSDPSTAFDYHLVRLMEGSSNPQTANEAALELAKLLDGNRLDSIRELVHHPDILVSRHALKLATQIPTAEAAGFLIEHLKELHHESMEDRTLKDVLSDFKALPGTGLQEMVFKHARTYLGEKTHEILLSLEASGPPVGPEALDPLRKLASCSADNFVVEALSLVLEGKSKLLSAHVKEVAEAMNRRGRWSGPALDNTAEGLQKMVTLGLIPREDVMQVLSLAYEKQTGRDGLARVLGTMVRPEESQTLDLILAGLDSLLRGAAIEAIGSRHEEAMLTFLLKACRDPIVDIAERAITLLGQLAGAAQATLELLKSSDPYETRLGIRITALNRMEAAVPALVGFLKACEREEFALDAYAALGSIASEEAVTHLLESLHSGQSPRVQVVIATALKETVNAKAAIGLAEQAILLKNPQLHALAAEALLLVHGDPSNPMPTEQVPLLRTQIQSCWEDKDPWPFRLRLIPLLGSLNCETPEFYDEMAALIGTLLADKRKNSAWSTQQQAEAQAAAKSLEQRAKGTKTAKAS